MMTSFGLLDISQDDPIYPGVLMIEAAAQISSILYHRNAEVNHFMGFTRCDKCSFRGQVIPGDTLRLFQSFANFNGDVLCVTHRVTLKANLSLKPNHWHDDLMNPYPLTFEPILKEKIWGGRRLEQFGKELPVKYELVSRGNLLIYQVQFQMAKV